MEFKEEPWGRYNGHDVKIFTVKDKQSGFLVSFTDLGATSLRVVVPDRNGAPGDIALSQETPERLIECKAHLGANVGRTANRIAKGKFTLEGKEYTLFINNGPNSLHGGKEGFDVKMWPLVHKQVTDSEVILKFEYVSEDMEEGYPGKLTTTITYFIHPNKLSWELEATTDKTTIVNLTNHNYWNLDGLATSINDQEVSIHAANYSPVDADGLTNGEITTIPPGLDTRKPKKFAEVFEKFGDVDNNFFLDEAKNWTKNQTQLFSCSEVYSPKTGRVMTIRTTQPCVQLYTGNFLGIEPITTSNGNHKVEKHGAFCLETQIPPNAINNNFREWSILHPGEKYFHRTEHEFKLRLREML